jgi:hypothetical protein
MQRADWLQLASRSISQIRIKLVDRLSRADGSREWSAPANEIVNSPAENSIAFFGNHRLLLTTARPVCTTRPCRHQAIAIQDRLFQTYRR